MPAPYADSPGRWEFLSSRDGHAEMSWSPTPDMANPFGSVHDGIIATVIDEACGAALMPLIEAPSAPTVSLNVEYLHALTENTPCAVRSCARAGRWPSWTHVSSTRKARCWSGAPASFRSPVRRSQAPTGCRWCAPALDRSISRSSMSVALCSATCTRRPADAVLGVQLGGQGSAGELAVMALLGAPGRILAVSVEADGEVTMAEHVVHGAEPVVGAADLGSHHGMETLGLARRRGHLQDAVSPDGRDEVVRVVVGRRGHGEEDAHGSAPAWVMSRYNRSDSSASWAYTARAIAPPVLGASWCAAATSAAATGSSSPEVQPSGERPHMVLEDTETQPVPLGAGRPTASRRRNGAARRASR